MFIIFKEILFIEIGKLTLFVIKIWGRDSNYEDKYVIDKRCVVLNFYR